MRVYTNEIGKFDGVMWTQGFAVGTVDAEVGANECRFTTTFGESIGRAVRNTCPTADTLIEVNEWEPLTVVHIYAYRHHLLTTA